MPRRPTSRGMGYGEKAVVKCISENLVNIIHSNLIRVIIVAYQTTAELSDKHPRIDYSPPSKCSSKNSTKLLFPPLRSIKPGISWTTSNVYAHLSPSVHPLSGPAQAPLAFLASMNPVSELKIVNGLFIPRSRKNTCSSVLLSRPASTDTAKSSSTKIF